MKKLLIWRNAVAPGRFISAAILTVVMSGATGAAIGQPAPLLPEGQTLITLSVTERQRVTQDVLIAELRLEAEDRDPAQVQNKINSQMTAGLQRAREVDGVMPSTGHYGVYQINRQPQGARPDPVWRGSQSISLQGTDADAVLVLVGELQEQGFIMNQLSYQLSTEKADEVRDAMMEAAIERARTKVERAGAALGKTQIDIAALNVDTGGSDYAPPMMMRAMAADTAEMAAPVAGAGETEVTLTINVQAVAR